MADIEDIKPFTAACGRYGKHYLLNAVFLGHVQDIVTPADYLHATHVAAVLGAVVVDDAHDIVLGMCAELELTQNHRACLSTADEHCALLPDAAVGAHPCTAKLTVQESECRAKRRKSAGIQQHEAAGHGYLEHHHADNAHTGGDH